MFRDEINTNRIFLNLCECVHVETLKRGRNKNRRKRILDHNMK